MDKIIEDLGARQWESLISDLKDLQRINKSSKVLLYSYVTVSWFTLENKLTEYGRPLSKPEITILQPILWEFSTNGYILNLNKLEFVSDKKNQNADLHLEDDDAEECRDNCTIYGYLSKTRDEKITEELSEDQFIHILYKHSDKDSENVGWTHKNFISYSISQTQ